MINLTEVQKSVVRDRLYSEWSVRSTARITAREHWQETSKTFKISVLVCIGVAILSVVIQEGWPSVVAALLLPNLWRQKQETGVPAKVQELLHADVEAYPAMVSLSFEGSLYGEDWGVVSYDRNWLHYEGLSFSFDLCPADFVSYARNGFGFEGCLRDGTNLKFCLTDLAVDKRQFHLPAVQTYSLRIGNWFESRTNDEGRSLYPPVHPPEGAKDPEGLTFLWLSLIGMLLGLIIALTVSGTELVFVLPIQLSAMIWAFCTLLRDSRRWKRIQNRRPI